MKLLALSGSTRGASTNTVLLRWLATVAGPGIELDVHAGLAELPIFSTDLEGDATPTSVECFAARIADADGLIISSPEYVRAIPGGLKNAIDWLVSREEVISKPVFLAHASNRGDDMLASLRIVLGTVSSRFDESVFFRLPLAGMSGEDIERVLAMEESALLAESFFQHIEMSMAEKGELGSANIAID